MNNIFFCDYIIKTFSFFLEEERREEAHAGGLAYSSSGPIPPYQEQGQQKNYPERSGSEQERRPSQSNKKRFNLLKGGISPGEELGGLTPNHRV